MKKLLVVIIALIVWYGSVSALSFFDNTSSVYTKNEQDAVKTDDICATDPLRCGMDNPGSRIQGLYYNGPINSVYQAQDATLGYVHNLINRGLTILGLIALCYLLYHGFGIVTWAGDEAKTKKGRQGLRTAAIAITGIWLSRLIVSLIIYLIDLFIP